MRFPRPRGFWRKAPTVAPWADRSSWAVGRRWDPTTADKVDDLKAISLLALGPTKIRPHRKRPVKP